MAILLAVLILFAVGACLGAWVFRPLDRAAKNRQAPAQFMLIDFLCLFVLAQLPLALIRWATAGTEVSEIGTLCVFGVFGWIACGFLWWVGLRTLSRAGVHRSWCRAVFLAIVLPVTVLSTMAFPILTLLLWAAVVEDADFSSGLSLPVAGGVEVALLAGFYAGGRYTRWLVSTASTPDRDAVSAAKSPEDG